MYIREIFKISRHIFTCFQRARSWRTSAHSKDGCEIYLKFDAARAKGQRRVRSKRCERKLPSRVWNCKLSSRDSWSFVEWRDPYVRTRTLKYLLRVAPFHARIHAREDSKDLSRLILSTVKFKFKPTYWRVRRVYVCVYMRLPGPFRSLFSRRRSAKVGGLSVGYRKYFPTPRIYRASARKYLKIPSTMRKIKRSRREREREGSRRDGGTPGGKLQNFSHLN